MYMSYNYDKPKAVRLNPSYGRSTGWIDKFPQISTLLGFDNMSPTPEVFADAVYVWQYNTAGLTADGIMGPKSWKAIEPLTHFTPAAPRTPDWARKQPPRKVAEEEVDKHVPSHIWMGMMIDIGGLMVVAGMNTMMGTLRSYDDPNICFDAMAERVRVGVGLGGGVGFSFVIVSNMKKSSQLNGLKSNSVDFALSVGVPIAKAAKSAIKYPRLVQIAKRLEKLAEAGDSAAVKLAAREASALKPDEFATIAKFVRENNALSDAASKIDGVQVCAVTLPLPGALEASVFWQQEMWTVLGP